MLKNLQFCALKLLALIAVTQPAKAADVIDIKFATDNWDNDAGSRSAGILCAPSGGYTNGDFFALLPIVLESLRKSEKVADLHQRMEAAAVIEISVKKTKLKLCAKKYGMFGKGKPDAMTGKAEFDTSLKVFDAQHETLMTIECKFSFDDYKKTSARVEQIFVDGMGQAVIQCLDQIGGT